MPPDRAETGMPQVSVVMCTFNGARFVRQQLTSILNQSSRPDEILVSDDGSTDDTVGIVGEVLARAEGLGIRTALVEGPSRGVTANFASALARATGDILVLSDQDDLWRTDRIALSIAAFTTSPDVILHHTDARLIDGTGARTGDSLYRTLGVGAGELASINLGDAFRVYLRRNLVTGAVTAIRRDLVCVAAPFPEEWVHDEWMAIIAAAVGRVRADTDTPVGYRQHGANQIGVVEPTLAYRVRRMFADPPGRNASLSARCRVLADRLSTLPGADPGYRLMAEEKARFESRRAGMPTSRILRLGAIVSAARGGAYQRFASQGRLDMVRDFVRRIPV